MSCPAFNIPFLSNLREVKVSTEAIKAIPAKLVQHHGFIPISLDGQVLTVVVFNPMDLWLAENIKLNLGFQVKRVLSTRNEVEKAIQKYYGAVAGTVDKIMEDKSGLGARVNKRDSIEDIEKSSDEVSVINLVNQIFQSEK